MQHFEIELHLNSRKKDEYSNLVTRSLKGDSHAQRALYEKLAPKMFPLCIRYMGDRQKAEDILQDGFVTLFSKLDKYSSEGAFEGWARKIFVNTALMDLRKSDVMKGSEDFEAARDTTSDETTAIEDIGYKDLIKMIGELPPGFRTVFNMYVVEGYSHKEIAKELNISENTSRSQLQRARVLLQSKIKERK